MHAIGVARDVIRWFLESQESVDDSSGSAGGAGHGLFAAHLRACQRLGTSSKFEGYLAELRTSQRRKRALLRILDHNGL